MRRDDPPLFSPVATQRSGGEDKYGLIRPSSKIRKNTGHRPAASCREQRQRLQRRYAGKNRHAGNNRAPAQRAVRRTAYCGSDRVFQLCQELVMTFLGEKKCLCGICPLKDKCEVENDRNKDKFWTSVINRNQER